MRGKFWAAALVVLAFVILLAALYLNGRDDDPDGAEGSTSEPVEILEDDANVVLEPSKPDSPSDNTVGILASGNATADMELPITVPAKTELGTPVDELAKDEVKASEAEDNQSSDVGTGRETASNGLQPAPISTVEEESVQDISEHQQHLAKPRERVVQPLVDEIVAVQDRDGGKADKSLQPFTSESFGEAEIQDWGRGEEAMVREEVNLAELLDDCLDSDTLGNVAEARLECPAVEQQPSLGDPAEDHYSTTVEPMPSKIDEKLDDTAESTVISQQSARYFEREAPRITDTFRSEPEEQKPDVVKSNFLEAVQENSNAKTAGASAETLDQQTPSEMTDVARAPEQEQALTKVISTSPPLVEARWLDLPNEMNISVEAGAEPSGIEDLPQASLDSASRAPEVAGPSVQSALSGVAGAETVEASAGELPQRADGLGAESGELNDGGREPGDRGDEVSPPAEIPEPSVEAGAEPSGIEDLPQASLDSASRAPEVAGPSVQSALSGVAGVETVEASAGELPQRADGLGAESGELNDGGREPGDRGDEVSPPAEIPEPSVEAGAEPSGIEDLPQASLDSASRAPEVAGPSVQSALSGVAGVETVEASAGELPQRADGLGAESGELNDGGREPGDRGDEVSPPAEIPEPSVEAGAEPSGIEDLPQASLDSASRAPEVAGPSVQSALSGVAGAETVEASAGELPQRADGLGAESGELNDGGREPGDRGDEVSPPAEIPEPSVEAGAEPSGIEDLPQASLDSASRAPEVAGPSVQSALSGVAGAETVEASAGELPQRADGLGEPANGEAVTLARLAVPLVDLSEMGKRIGTIDDGDSVLGEINVAEPGKDETDLTVADPEGASGTAMQGDVNGTSTAPQLDSHIEATPARPKFDVVRADRNGIVVVAGRAEPGSLVAAVADNVLAETTANAVGAFATVFKADYLSTALDIYLTSRLQDGTVLRSDETLHLILPAVEIDSPTLREDDPVTALSEPVDFEPNPVAVVSTKDDVRILQSLIPKAVESSKELLLETISYDEEGEVKIGGRGRPDSEVRIYLDGTFIKSRKISPGGTWSVSLAEADLGVYVLRIDELNGNGEVIARAETPFKKESREVVKQLSAASTGTVGLEPTAGKPPRLSFVTVQRGYTMWGISRKRYGLGRLYIQIFHVNRDQIRDPHWIYPGQVFLIPDPDDFVDLGCDDLSRCKLIQKFN